jgi:hypothetical protein
MLSCFVYSCTRSRGPVVRTLQPLGSAVTLERMKRLGCGMAQPTVTKSVNLLLELGILEEISGRQKGRVFGYDKYMKVLSEGTEPLPQN